MSGFKNEYILNVDIKKRLASPVPVFKRGDNAVLKFKVFDDGALLDLSDFTKAELTQVLPSGTAFKNEAQLIDGYIVYTFDKEEMLEIGKISITLSIYSRESVVSVQPFNIFMYDEMDGKTLSYIGVLQELISEVKILDKQTEESLGFIQENLELLTESILNEKQRILNENERIANEEQRKLNEQDRQTAETDRETSEQNRKDAEIIREQQETDRQTAETSRDNAEQLRINAETVRGQNEQQRINAEIDRDTEETKRQTAETERITKESERQTAEQTRKDNEDARIANEQQREQNEQQRQQNESNRQSTFDSKIQEVDTVIIHATHLENVESWDSTKQYYKNNIVEYDGSSFMALKDNIGQQPPILPTKQNEYWSLLAQRGVDGQGAVNKVNGKSPDVDGNIELTPQDIKAIPISEKGVAGGVARLNEQGKVVDASGNEVEGKVTSVNGMIGDVTGLETVADSDTKVANALTDANTYTDTKITETRNYADAKANEAYNNSKAYTDDLISSVTETGVPSLANYPYVLTATQDGQLDYVIPLETFNASIDALVLVVLNRTTLDITDFEVTDNIEVGRTLTLNIDPSEVKTGDTVYILIMKNAPIGSEGTFSGAYLQNDTVTKTKLEPALRSEIDGKETPEGSQLKANTAESNAKAYTDQQIHLVTETGIPKLVRYEYTLYPTVDNQSTFEIPLDIFDVETDSEVIVKNTVTLDPNEDYTITGKTITLTTPVSLDTRLTVFIYKNVPIGEEGAINGEVLANGTIAFEKLDTATKELINSKANSTDLTTLQQEVNEHLAEDVTKLQGVHGFRVINGKGQYYDKIEGEWKDIAGSGSGISVGNVINFIAGAGDGEVTLTWKDPADVTITDSNNNVITIARWKGTKITMKTTPDFAHENDGVLVVDNGIRNQYAENGFKVTGLTNGQTYYFMAFPYTDGNVYTIDEANRVEATPTVQRIYGVRIDKNNSNPETRVTYIGDAVGFTPMRGNNGNFSWGSWQNVFESFEIRPVVLQNRQVKYYLKPNDFTKKADGSNAVLDGTDGDVMIEFGKPLWWKWTDEGDTYTIEISDKEFDGAVKHAFEIEEGYNLVPYYPLLLTQVLFVIFFKSTDSQTALGRGRVDGATGDASTGSTNNKGMFYGSANDEQMKFLGIEDYWGNKFWWIDGLVTDNNFNLLIGKGNFNDNGSGYQTFTSGVSSSMSGYINSVQGGNDKGFIIKSGSGSATTYYADYGSLNSARVAHFGGYRSNGSDAGFAYLQLNYSGSYSFASLGARLFCASNGKIYIGAYLGTTQSGKLRSISGTPEPTGSKTIGTFRNEARTNN